MKMDGRISLGINVSIILTLAIFTGLLVLPLKLLLNTNYVQQNLSTNIETKPIEFRSLQLCPADYKHWVTSAFISNYDRNCTYYDDSGKGKISDSLSNDGGKANVTNLSIGGFRVIRPKSVPVTDHILAMMLIVSIIGAFVEMLRIRFINPKVFDQLPVVRKVFYKLKSQLDLFLEVERRREGKEFVLIFTFFDSLLGSSVLIVIPEHSGC